MIIGFWKDVAKINSKRVPLASTVGGASGSDNIAEMWKKHFSNIMNSDNQHDHHRTTVEDKLAATQYNTDMNFTVADITYAI